MITGPLFKWFGSKWLSSKILPEPQCDTIIEPFAGGAGYSLRHSQKKVILVETDPHIGAIKHWRYFSGDGRMLMLQWSEHVTWFIDPPYQFNYQYKAASIDYLQLAQIIDLLQGQVIVCEALCQKTNTRPTWLPFEDFGSRITSRRKAGDNHHSRELIYERRAQ